MPDSTATSQSPQEFCRVRLALRTAETRRLSRRLSRFVKTKRTFISIVVGYAVFDPGAALLLLPLLVLLVPAVIVQNRIGRRLERVSRAAEFHRHALARIEDRWIGDGENGEQYLGDDEIFADDLDVFGNASLFQFLCTARTPIGRDTLADWLSEPADADEIRERQSAVRELNGYSELRERLAMLDLDRYAVDPRAVLMWANAPELLPDGLTRISGFVLAVVFAAVIGSGFAFPVPISVAVIVLELTFFALVRDRLRPISASGPSALSTLSYLSAVQSAMRNLSFNSRRLSDIQRAITSPGTRITVGFRAYRMASGLPPLLLLLCQTNPRIDRRRRSLAITVEKSLEALGELEALASLAHYAFVQPEATYPEVVTTETCYEAADLAHPLIPASERVRNDFLLNDTVRLMLVSGSNMSGKSTMLRTVGVNAVLALCGAPVCGRDVRISPFSIGTAMRFQDSMEQKSSHFHAVITRLRRVMQLLSGDQPLLFLIDEILQGTNSRDRIEGAEAIVRRLTDRGGVGMVTTHDLELTQIVGTFDGRAVNVHFVDQLVESEIHCDYKMRPGVVPTSNALALMRKMGLDV